MALDDHIQSVKERYQYDTDLHSLLDEMKTLIPQSRIRRKVDTTLTTSERKYTYVVWFIINAIGVSKTPCRIFVEVTFQVNSKSTIIDLEREVARCLVNLSKTQTVDSRVPHIESAENIVITDYKELEGEHHDETRTLRND